MKIGKSWRTRGYYSAKFLSLFLGLVVICGILAPRVFAAEPTTRDVSPGAGTLKQAVKDAQDGDTLRLKSGSYTGNWSDGREVEIDKSLTIVGEGAGKTTIDVPIKITAADKTVTLKNFGSPTTAVEKDFVYVSVDAKTNLTIEDVMIWGMLRGENGAYPRHNATGINIGPDASGSKITLNNVRLEKPAVRYGILNKASDTTIDVNGQSKIDARVVAEFDTGSNNILNINEGVEVSGPSAIYTDTETITIKNQKDLQINLNGGKIIGTLPSNNAAIKVFAVDKESTGMKMSLKNGASISVPVRQSNLSLANTIFAFDSETTAANNHEITVDASSRLYTAVQGGSRYDVIDTPDAPVEREYSKLNNAAVVSVADKDGNRTIRIYDSGAEIEGLKDTNNIEKENHFFEGWYKGVPGAEGSEEFAKLESGDYPTAQSGVNLDLYPKFLKKVKVTIGGDSYELKEGQTIESIEGIDAKLEALKKEDTNHRGYIMHGETGGDMSFTVSQVEDLKDFPITEDVTIEAVHDVTITVNDQPFDVEIGQTVADIADQNAYKAAKLDEQEEKYFSRLVNNDNNETFEETTPINNNIEVTTKHYLPVKVNGDATEYLVEEGKKLSEDKYGALIAALTAVKEAPVENKTFGRFVDGENQDVNPEDYVVDKATTIKPIYTVEVKIDGNTYTLDEGQALSDHSDHEQIAEALKKLAADVKAAGREFTGFVVSSAGKEEVVLVKDDGELETKVQEVLGKAIAGNTDIYAKYFAKVTINCLECDGGKAEFEVETGSKLAALLNGDNKANYEKAKYQEYESDPERDERFGGFVAENGEPFTEEQEIEKSMTLTPKYYLFVTIEDERPEVSGKFRIEQDKDLDEMVPMSGQETDTAAVLFTLRSDIVPEVGADGQIDPNAEDLHFDKLVKVVGDATTDMTDEIINEDTTIRAMYHYDVIVVEDYDNPNADLSGAHSGTYGFKVYRGEGLGSVTDKLGKIETALRGLMDTATKPELGRRFYRFYDEKLGVTYDADALKSKAFNRHLYITAKVEYKVTVENDPAEYYVMEGETVGSSEALKGEMTELKAVENKQFANYTWNGNVTTEDNLLAQTVNSGDNKIGAKYNVAVTIGEQTFIVPENGTLENEVNGKQQEARAALQALYNQVIADKQTFEGFNIGSDAVDGAMEHPFAQNTTVVANRSITVKIDEDTYEDLTTDGTLAEKVDLDKYKTMRDAEDMEFSRFVDEDGNTFDENAPLAKNETLTTKYAYKVTVGEDTYKVEENTRLGDDPALAGKLAELRNAKPEKTFGRFVDSDGQKVDENTVLSKSTEISPVYQVTVKIGDHAYTLDENGKLSSLDGDGSVSTALESLENPGNKVFYTYLVNGRELSREELLNQEFGDNAEVTVKYNVAVRVGEDDAVLVPEGTRLGDAIEVKGKMDAYAIPEGKTRVAYFVDEAGNPVNDESVFAVNTVLTPKYMIAVKVTGQDDNGEPIEVEPLELELLEGTSLSQLSDEENQKLQNWIKDNRLALAEVGKEKYDFDHFVNEKGETVDMKTPLTDGPVELTAVFAYKPEVEPQPQPPVEPTTPEEGTTSGNVSETTDNSSDNQPGSPDTGMNNVAGGEYLRATGIVTVVVALTIAGATAIRTSRKSKKD